MRVPVREVKAREQKILELLQKRKTLSIDEIIQEFNISTATARRHMLSLEEGGFAFRTLKGIMVKAKEEYEVDISQKTTRNLKEKQLIAKRALSLIKPQDILFIGDGSTTFELAKLLNSVSDILVVTNSIIVANQLFPYRNIDLQILGGSVRNVTGAVTGERAVEYLKNMHFNKAFLGADSISLEHGITTPNYFGVMTELTAMTMSKEVYILADGSKFDRVSFTPLVPLRDISAIITDSTISKEYLAKMREKGHSVIVCDE